MTAEERAALVERVARAICKAEGDDPDSLDPWMEPEHQFPAWEHYEGHATAAIDLIRAETLEEAASVAEFRVGATEWSAETNSGYECAAREIAADIRAMKQP